jgi:hypothetical protein
MPRELRINETDIVITDEELAAIEAHTPRLLQAKIKETLNPLATFDSKLRPETYGYALSGLEILHSFQTGTVTAENIIEKAGLCFRLDEADTSDTLREFINLGFAVPAQHLLANLTPGREAEFLEQNLFRIIYATCSKDRASPEEDSYERKLAFAIVSREVLMNQFEWQIAFQRAFLLGKRGVELSEEYQKGLPESSHDGSSRDGSSRDDSSSPDEVGVGEAEMGGTGAPGVATMPVGAAHFAATQTKAQHQG